MSWSIVAILAVGAVVGLRALRSRQPSGDARSRYDLEHCVRSLLLLRAGEGQLQVRHRRSRFRMRVTRHAEDGAPAELILSVPRASWSETKRSEIERLCEHQGLSCAVQPDDLLDPQSLIETRLDVPAIWVDEAAARVARLSHRLLDVFGVGPTELLEVRLGTPTGRPGGRSRDPAGDA